MNQEEVNEVRAECVAKSHDPLSLIAHSHNSFNFPTTHKDQSSSSTHSQQPFPINNKYHPKPSLNQNFIQPPMTSLKDINDPTEAMNVALILFAKAFQLSAPTNNNKRTSSNPRNRQIAQPVMNMGQDRQIQNVRGNGGNQFGQYAGQVAQNQQGFNAWQNGIANQSGTGNVVAARAEGTGIRNQTRCYNCRGLGHIARNCTVRPRRRDAAYLQTQLLIAQKEEQASTSGTQHDKAPVYDTDGSAEVHINDNYYDNKIFNMFTQEEQYTDLLEPIPEPQLVPQNDNLVTSVAPSMVQSGGTVETSSALNEEIRAHQETMYRNLVDQVAHVDMVNRNMRATNAELKSELARYKIQEQHVEISNVNKQLSKEKSSISSFMDEKKRLKHDLKIREDKFLDKEVDLEAKIKDLENILLKNDQTVQTIHMLNPKPDSFYHSNQKRTLGYPNPSYLKKAQQKQQSSYNGNLLLEEHDPPAVYDSEETLELAQESRERMRYLNKEIKPANYAKINHLSGGFVPQTTKSKEEFLNEVKSSLVTLQRVVKQKMTLEVHNSSSSAHKEVHIIISHEIVPIINQVDARVQNFEIQFLHEAAKFVRDFKSLAKKADESLDKQKSLEIEIERLLKASVSHDIMPIVQNSFVDTSYDKAYNDMQQKVKRLQAQLRDLKGKSSDTPSASNTLDPLNQNLESKIVELEFQVTYESVKNTSGTSVTSHVDKPKLSVVTPHSKKLQASTQSHSVPQPREFNAVKHRNVITPGMFKINPSKTPRVDLVPNKQSSTSIRTNPITNSQQHVTVKENVNSDTVTASSTGLSSEVKKVKAVEDHRRTLLLSQNRKTMSSECCSKHMTGNIKLLINFVWKFLGTVRFANDHIAAILGYGDLKWGNITITRVYFVEGLGHNIFSVGQFCDADLEVAFRRNTCFIRDLDGVDLLKGYRSTNLYTINLYDMASASPICLMAQATPNKSWLWRQ
nr:integrase, catalytic region, zinc finger, CCHC-type, peptidase aspartic, catalytic [Tanacetum cinerariifolium]